jgi:hypothetical protein
MMDSALSATDDGTIVSIDGVRGTSRGQGGAEFLFSPPLQLATVLILHACCLLYSELDGSNEKHHLGGHGGPSAPPNPSTGLASSPFFSLLVQDALKTLFSLQKRHPSRDRVTQEVIDGFYQFIETSLLLPMLGSDRWDRAQQLVSARGDVPGAGALTERNGTASILSLLQEAIEEQIPSAASESQSQTLQESTAGAYAPATRDYVSPFVWARTESELNDLKRIVEKSAPTSYPTSTGDSLPASALLEPMAGIRTPFARPLPPPLLPLFGCT